MKYRRKEVINAIQFNEKSPRVDFEYQLCCDGIQVDIRYELYCDSMIIDLTGEGKHSCGDIIYAPYVATYEDGWKRIVNGDYITTDIEGRVSIIDRELFESLYEPLYPLLN